jgi:hypothetical protein
MVEFLRKCEHTTYLGVIIIYEIVTAGPACYKHIYVYYRESFSIGRIEFARPSEKHTVGN